MGLRWGLIICRGADGQVGVTWPFVVRKILQQDNIGDALACITEAKLAGAHNYLLFDREGNGFNVEAMSTHYEVEALGERPITHTNHCLIPENLTRSQIKLPESQAHSEDRLAYATAVLDSPDSPVTVEQLQQLTREFPVCTPPDPVFHVSTCGAVIMRPKTAELWAVWGMPVEGEYERFVVGNSVG